MIHSSPRRSLNWSGVNVVHLRPTYFLEWLLYPWQLPYLPQGVLRMPVGKGRHSPIAADDQGRAIARLLQNSDGHIGTTIPISGPVEMDHEQMAAELSEALGKTIVFQDLPVEEYVKSLRDMGVPPYVVQHLGGAMVDYQNGHMSGADDNVERLTGRPPMTVGEFARARRHPQRHPQLTPSRRCGRGQASPWDPRSSHSRRWRPGCD